MNSFKVPASTAAKVLYSAGVGNTACYFNSY